MALFGNDCQTPTLVIGRGNSRALRKDGGFNCSSTEDGQDPKDFAWSFFFSWLQYIPDGSIPKFRMHASFRLGKSACDVLHETDTVPQTSSSCNSDAALNLVLLYGSNCLLHQSNHHLTKHSTVSSYSIIWHTILYHVGLAQQRPLLPS